MANVFKVNLEAEAGGVPIDTVEKLLTLASEGADLVVFSDEGHIIFVKDDTNEFEEV